MFCKAIVYFVLVLQAAAQSQSFAKITIKPARSTDTQRTQVHPGGEWIATGISVGRLMNLAYNLPANGSSRFSTLPIWTMTDKYDIEATAPENTIHPGLQDSEVRSRIQQMVRSLLADRFGLSQRAAYQTNGRVCPDRSR